jgi:hypothetical protein
MKKILLLSVFLFIFFGSQAQVDKTQLSTDVSKKYSENFTNLSQYTWKRTVNGFVDGTKVMSSLSSVQVGQDGKIEATLIQKDSFSDKKEGSAEVNVSKFAENDEYIKNAIELSLKYVYLSNGEFVDFFNKGTVSVLINNVMQAEAFNFLVKGDHMNYKYEKSTLLYISQDFSTVMNGDPVKAIVSYETINGLNRVSNVEITLPAKNIKLTLVNFDFAKKL